MNTPRAQRPLAHHLRAAALALGALALPAPPAVAQLGGGVEAKKDVNAKVEPPSPNLKAEEPSSWPQYVLGGILILVALGANLIPTKRGHQD